MAGSPTAAWMPKRPEQAPAEVSGPRFAAAPMAAPTRTPSTGRATRPFRFGSEDRPDPDPPLGPGSVIGDRYAIVRLLGEGGMGRVYEAQHIVLRRRVALKLLRRDAAAEAENLARFRQEALAASRIGAPEIVEVVDFASQTVASRQQTYMVMELLTGESLEAWMDRPAPLDQGLAILASLCDGLVAAHRAAVVHRDIKPANVFLPTPDPGFAGQARVKILDFGIAKITAGGEGFQTRQGSLLGTPYYLAPERVMGAALTGAADIYSVGVILYEMLTGNVPFVADSFMGILANHVHTPALDPRQAAPDRPIPGSIAQLCLRLLSKDPSARPTADQVAAELRSLLASDASELAAGVIGPRGVSTPSADTQILADATRELTPVGAVDTVGAGAEGAGGGGAGGGGAGGGGAGGRSSTRIGHEPAAGGGPIRMDTRGSVAVSPSLESGPGARSRGPWLGLGATVGVAALGFGLWIGLRQPQPVGSNQPEPVEPVEQAQQGEQVAPAVETVEPPTPTPVAVPAEAGLTAVPAAREDSPATEPGEPSPAPPPSVKPSGKSQRDPRESAPSSRGTKPEPDAPDPAPEPAVDPPQPDPPAPAPEADPDLPTIKDDVYD